jgi:hypothetical protein
MPEGVIDEALERFAATGPEFGGGLSNHGPMGAEALLRMGRDDVVLGWSEWYAQRLPEHPAPRSPIAPDGWREALGDIGRVADWGAFFARELAAQPWRDLLDTWVARLAPGIMAAATHGVIRTAHAVRLLADAETPPRLFELGEALAYWAARYHALPERPYDGPRRTPADALVAMPLLDQERRKRGLITVNVRALDPDEFGEVIDYVDPGADAAAFVSAITPLFVRGYLTYAGSDPIAFIHSVTAPNALRTLAPHLSPPVAAAAMRYTWQACAALHAAFALPGARPPSFDAPPELAPDDLIDRAVAARDEHAIKFTLACLREHGQTGDPAFIAAAADVVDRLGGRPK